MARPRSFDHDHVLHAAERQFRASGYNGTSVDDISAATGLGRGSLYAAFDGKHGVLLQAMAGYFARLGQFAPKALAGPDEGALERLHAYLLRAVHGVPLAADVPPAPDRAAATCFAAKMALEIGASDPEVKRLLAGLSSVPLGQSSIGNRGLIVGQIGKPCNYFGVLVVRLPRMEPSVTGFQGSNNATSRAVISAAPTVKYDAMAKPSRHAVFIV
ncbi:TetR/AcrR family transcriptional regulator [Streptomyces sp. NPDC002130]|uniref:TetR/AcrR family transcriptional regulator n=1 Tax=Streptomyces sp. NPDC002130 TaxID=3155568 RepID=UPI0033344038